jgi:hypothetical protein
MAHPPALTLSLYLFLECLYRGRHGDIAAIHHPDTWHRILSNSNTTTSISFSWFVYAR